MKKLAIVLSFLVLCAGVAIAGEHGTCDMKNHVKTADMTGKIFTKDNVRYFQASNSDKAYPICEHSTAAGLDKLDNVNVKVKASIIKCEDEDGKQVAFIEKASKI